MTTSLSLATQGLLGANGGAGERVLVGDGYKLVIDGEVSLTLEVSDTSITIEQDDYQISSTKDKVVVVSPEITLEESC